MLFLYYCLILSEVLLLISNMFWEKGADVMTDLKKSQVAALEGRQPVIDCSIAECLGGCISYWKKGD